MRQRESVPTKNVTSASDANGDVAAINGGVGKKAKSIPQAAGAPIEKVANPQADAFGSNSAVTTHGSDIVKTTTETEALETTIAVNPDEGTTAADNNNEAITVNDKDSFTLSGIDPAGNTIRSTLKFVPMNKTKFVAALKEKGIRHTTHKYWKGPQHDYILERGSWPTKNADGHSTALASLYLNDAVHEMFELSFQDPTSTSAPHTVDFQNVLSTHHHTVFVNDIKLSQSHCNTVPIKDSDILHFLHNIHPQFAFAFTIELSVTIQLS